MVKEIEFFGQVTSGDTQSALAVGLNLSPAAAISRRAAIILKEIQSPSRAWLRSVSLGNCPQTVSYAKRTHR